MGEAMTIRTTRKTVKFTRPFTLDGSNEEFPEGDYIVETDEELVEGISFPAYRRIATLIHLHSERKFPGRLRTMTLDPKALEAALVRDTMPERPVATRTADKARPFLTSR
jgi:hypothetical protein